MVMNDRGIKFELAGTVKHFAVFIQHFRNYGVRQFFIGIGHIEDFQIECPAGDILTRMTDDQVRQGKVVAGERNRFSSLEQITVIAEDAGRGHRLAYGRLQAGVFVSFVPFETENGIHRIFPAELQIIPERFGAVAADGLAAQIVAVTGHDLQPEHFFPIEFGPGADSGIERQNDPVVILLVEQEVFGAEIIVEHDAVADVEILDETVIHAEHQGGGNGAAAVVVIERIAAGALQGTDAVEMGEFMPGLFLDFSQNLPVFFGRDPVGHIGQRDRFSVQFPGRAFGADFELAQDMILQSGPAVVEPGDDLEFSGVFILCGDPAELDGGIVCRQDRGETVQTRQPDQFHASAETPRLKHARGVFPHVAGNKKVVVEPFFDRIPEPSGTVGHRFGQEMTFPRDEFFLHPLFFHGFHEFHAEFVIGIGKRFDLFGFFPEFGEFRFRSRQGGTTENEQEEEDFSHLDNIPVIKDSQTSGGGNSWRRLGSDRSSPDCRDGIRHGRPEKAH